MSLPATDEPILIRCPRCNRPIDVASIATSDEATCPLCTRTFEAVRFNPPTRAVALPQMIAGTLDAGQPCANHPRNAAVTGCGRCGTFICVLCRVDVDELALCPGCFDRLSSEGSLESTRTTFRDYPGLASVSATAGCLIWVLAIILGPLAIYYGVKAWRQKKAMGETDGKVGIVVAMTIGALETIGSAVLVGYLLAAAVR